MRLWLVGALASLVGAILGGLLGFIWFRELILHAMTKTDEPTTYS